jgi:hypothetical protein
LLVLAPHDASACRLQSPRVASWFGPAMFHVKHGRCLLESCCMANDFEPRPTHTRDGAWRFPQAIDAVRARIHRAQARSQRDPGKQRATGGLGPGSNGRTAATGATGGLERGGKGRTGRREQGATVERRESRRLPGGAILTTLSDLGYPGQILGETRSVQAYGRGNCPIFNHLPARFT